MDLMETIITFFQAYGFIWSVHNKITIDKMVFPSYIQTSLFLSMFPWFFPIWSHDFPLQPAARRLMTLSCGQMQRTATSFILWQSTDLIESTRKNQGPEKLRVNSLTSLISDLTYGSGSKPIVPL